MSLGTGLGRLKGRAFRLGHLGDFNELMLLGMLCGVEMGLSLAGVPFTRGGVDAAMQLPRQRAHAAAAVLATKITKNTEARDASL